MPVQIVSGVALGRIPPGALVEWSALGSALAEAPGDVPCRAGDTEAWWQAPQDVGGAAEACAGCPVRAPCLAYAVAADERDGVWGGLVRAERLQLDRPRPPEAEPVGVPVRDTY